MEGLFLSEKLEESKNSSLVVVTIVIIFGLLISLTLWLYFVDIEEVSTAPGVVIPSDNIYPIQHLEGGIVYKSFIKDGDIVQAGDRLFELSPEPATSDLNRVLSIETMLGLDIKRLRTFISNQPLNRKDLENAIVYKQGKNKSVDLLIDNALLLFQHQIGQRRNEQLSVDKLIKNKQQHLVNLDKQIDHLEQRKNILTKQTNIHKKLNKSQYGSKITLLTSQDKLEDAKGEYLETAREKTTVESSIIELNNQLRLNEMLANRAALEELNKLIGDLLEIRKQIQKAQDIVNRLQVLTPVYGIIKGAKVKPGNVIAAGEVVLDIVPITKQLVIEARISPQDIGHISLGDPAKLKVSSYDFSTYGQLHGKVKSISATTFLDEKGEPYYKAIITVEQKYLGDDPSTNLILPGMVVTANIQTDQRSLLTYFLKPVNRTFYDAFRER